MDDAVIWGAGAIGGIELSSDMGKSFSIGWHQLDLIEWFGRTAEAIRDVASRTAHDQIQIIGATRPHFTLVQIQARCRDAFGAIAANGQHKTV